jgi:GNAT superfamily N-acetyltransferase
MGFWSSFVIKIGPLIATDYGKTCALLGLQEEPVLDVQSLTESGLVLRSLSFWQHWLPCQYHVTPSVYVAREDHQVLGFISLHNNGKAKACWRIDNLVVHPEHRGRGIAQELLKFVFAQFGSQGVSHFIAEVSAHNDAALSLFASCGFCRSTQVTYYRLVPNSETELVEPATDEFKIATPMQKQSLYMVYQDSLPPDLRVVLNLSPEDFRVKDIAPFTSVEKNKNRLMRRRVWYCVSEDHDRKAITGAVRVTAQPGLGYRLDVAVHPGWRHMASDVVNSAINLLLSENVPRMPIWVRAYDFQTELHEVVKQRGFERLGDYFLLAREHWQRAKHPKKRRVEGLKPIANPAVNFPLAKECRPQPGQN